MITPRQPQLTPDHDLPLPYQTEERPLRVPPERGSGGVARQPTGYFLLQRPAMNDLGVALRNELVLRLLQGHGERAFKIRLCRPAEHLLTSRPREDR